MGDVFYFQDQGTDTLFSPKHPSIQQFLDVNIAGCKED